MAIYHKETKLNSSEKTRMYTLKGNMMCYELCSGKTVAIQMNTSL